MWGENDATEQNDGWNTDRDGNSGWGVSNDAKDAVDGWSTGNNDTWDQTDTKDAAVDGWSTDNNNNWEHNDTGGFEGWDANNTAWKQPQDSTNDTPFNANAGNTRAAPAAPVVEDKPNPPPPSARHRSKSLLKHRQLSSPPAPTPHWHFPPPPQTPPRRRASNGDSPQQKPTAPSPRLYKTPSAVAAEKGVQHQAPAGAGTPYGHAVNRPEYLDRLDRPYAVFRFKYRSPSVLRGLFGSACLSQGVGREGLQALSRDELLGSMAALQMQMQMQLERKRGAGESRCAESVAVELTEKWVEEHSRQPAGARVEVEGGNGKAGGGKSRAEEAERVAAGDDGAGEFKNVRW